MSYEPTDRQLDALNKLSSNDGRFAKTLCAKRHKVIRNELSQKYYHPLSIPDQNIHYVAVPNRNPEYELDMQTLRIIMSNKTSDNNKRIAKNTLLLYFRMLFMMVVSLYTSRVILNALGVEDFRIL